MLWSRVDYAMHVSSWYFREWRKSQLNVLKQEAKRFQTRLEGQTSHLLEYETYLKDRFEEISEMIVPKKQ
eukprot:s5580_g2.t1